MSDCNEPEGITIAEYEVVDKPINQEQTLFEVQQTDQEVGYQSRKMSVETLVEEISPQLQQYTDEAITELDSGIQGKIDASIADENIQGKIDASIAAIPSAGDLAIESSKPTVQGWIDESITAENIQGKIDTSIAAIPPATAPRTTILRDGETFTLPGSAEIGDNFELFVHQPVTRGYIQQVADTTLMSEDFRNPSGADWIVKTRNPQLLRLTYLSDELVEDRDYEYLTDLLDTPVNEGVSSMALSPDGRYIGLGLDDAPWFAIYRIDGTQFRRVAVSTSGLFSESPLAFAFNPENNDIHFGMPGNRAHMILEFDGTELTFKERIRDNSNAATYSISFSPNGRYKAEGHSGGTVTITDLTTNTEVDHPWTSTGATDIVHSLAFSPSPPEGSDQLLAIGHFGDPCMSFLSFSNGVITKLQRPRAIRHRAEAIKSMAWSHDGELLAVNLSSSEIVVYDMTGGRKNIASVLTELNTQNGDKNSGSTFMSVAFSKFKHLGVSWGYAANIYNFENNVVPDTYFKRVYPGTKPGYSPVLWTVGGGYFLFGGGVRNFSVYHALKFIPGVWFVSRLDGPDIQASDFSSIGSPALTPEEEIKPAETPEEETAEAETPEEEPKPAKKKRRKKEGK